MMKTIYLVVSLLFLMTTINAQSDYRNDIVQPACAPGTAAIPADLVTHNAVITVAGVYSPMSNDIPAIQNPSNAQRIFLSGLITGGSLFHKAYLLNALDAYQIQAAYRYQVHEVKFLANYYLICGSVSCSNPGNTFNDAFLMKVDSQGDLQWFMRYRAPTQQLLSFQSVEAVISNNVAMSYVAVGFRADPQGIRRAILVELDSIGNVKGIGKQLLEPLVAGFQPHSAYRRIIAYDNQHFAVLGSCGQIADNCGKFYQSDMVLSMYQAATQTLVHRRAGLNGFGLFNKLNDEGVSLVKVNSGLVLLANYNNANGLSCSTQPDHWGSLARINITTPMNPATWVSSKTWRYNVLPGFGFRDQPRDLLYETASGANPVLRVYGQYNANLGYLLRMQMPTGQHLMLPRLTNNHQGSPNADGRTIAWNSQNRVIGLSSLFGNRYSVFEMVNNTQNGCKSDSMNFNFLSDSMFLDNRQHDTLSILAQSLLHFSADITVNQNYYCGSPMARPEEEQSLAQEESETLNIYPNPARNLIRVRGWLEQGGDCRIQIMTIEGRGVFDRVWKEQPSGVVEWEVALDGLRSGMYVLVVENNGQIRYSKFLKASD